MVTTHDWADYFLMAACALGCKRKHTEVWQGKIRLAGQALVTTRQAVRYPKRDEATQGKLYIDAAKEKRGAVDDQLYTTDMKHVS